MDEKTALELYTIFRHENSLWLANYREHSQQYFTLVITILAASIAAISQFDTLAPPLMLLVAVGPLVNLFLCQIAVSTCNRSYQVFLEGISIQAKLEPIIGLTDPRNPPTEYQPVLQFSKDEYFLPERWLQSRHFATATKFVEEGMKKGANRLITRTFQVLALINIAIFLGIVVYGLIRLLEDLFPPTMPGFYQ